MAAAIASLQRESAHPQVMLFAEPQNTIGSLFDDAEVRSEIDAEPKSLTTPSHASLPRIFSTSST
ncbi:hypothetical protein OA163_00560 [bacterium]|nr:hypothetical protein [bacterium]